ncbi:MAG: protein translocase subunit SecD [Nitrospinae bacterium]|nr:protein translocase subunit SecD [Nitrospinota bacterium]
MRKEHYWRIALIVLVVVGSLFLAYPLNEKINLGLDLQGGMHLVLEVEADKAVESMLSHYADNLSDSLNSNEAEDVFVKYSNATIVVEYEKGVSGDVAGKIGKDFPELVSEPQSEEGKIVYRFSEDKAKEIREKAVDQGLETIRNRIDQFGVAEPSIQREGEERIVVQLPGIKDTQRAINLIGKTARLEFKMVDDEGDLEAALNGDIPEGDEILYERRVDDVSGQSSTTPFLLKKKVMMTGEYITSADVRIDTQYNEPYVIVSFDKIGGKLFGKITRENVGRHLAIVLDGNIYSAPVIREEIGGGSAQITGSFTTEEAHDLAISLRAGSLPAPVRILENRTVGPSLGRDSINRGLKSMMIGGLLVILFMIFYYRGAGLIAVFALSMNIVILLGCMAYFKATLTLPGIAGIILTIGMAVDANILIFERIREELEIGKTVRSAVEAGFARAFLTILDANITTLISAIVLFQFGTGPIKGFAVTLSVGILASMFTAVFVSHVLFNMLTLRSGKVTKLSI